LSLLVVHVVGDLEPADEEQLELHALRLRENEPELLAPAPPVEPEAGGFVPDEDFAEEEIDEGKPLTIP